MMRLVVQIISCRIVVLAGCLLAVLPAMAFAKPTPGQFCSSAKLLAVAKDFGCVSKETGKSFLNKTAHPEKCTTQLLDAFAKAEAKGGCPITGDGATVAPEVEAVEAAVFAVANNPPADVFQKKCVVKANAMVPKHFVHCLAKRLSARVKGSPPGAQSAYDLYECAIGLDASLGELVGSLAFSDCPLGLASAGPALRGQAGFAGAYLPFADLTGVSFEQTINGGVPAPLSQADFSHADLSAADLAGAELGGADLTGTILSGADLTGAVLQGADWSAADVSNVIWGGTICPDGTLSSSNGSSPESCCGHGTAPAACSP